MEGAVRSLFIPLSLAVGASMVTSYLLSSTLVPVLSVWLLKPTRPARTPRLGQASPGFFVQGPGSVRAALTWVVAHRRVVVLILPDRGHDRLRGRLVAPEARPRAVPEGRRRPVPASRPPAAGDAVRVDPAGRREDLRRDRRGGRARTTSTSRWATSARPRRSSSSTRPISGAEGPRTPCSAIGLKSPRESKVGIFELAREAPRRSCRRRSAAGSSGGTDPKLGRARGPGRGARPSEIVFAFEPGDLISSTMSLGSPAPIEVVVSGRDLTQTGAFMEKIRGELNKIEPSATSSSSRPCTTRPSRLPSTASVPGSAA